MGPPGEPGPQVHVFNKEGQTIYVSDLNIFYIKCFVYLKEVKAQLTRQLCDKRINNKKIYLLAINDLFTVDFTGSCWKEF